MIFRIKLTANGAAATLRLDYEGSEKKHQCIPFIQKDNQNTETGSTVNLSSLFYGKDGLLIRTYISLAIFQPLIRTIHYGTCYIN